MALSAGPARSRLLAAAFGRRRWPLRASRRSRTLASHRHGTSTCSASYSSAPARTAAEAPFGRRRWRFRATRRSRTLAPHRHASETCSGSYSSASARAAARVRLSLPGVPRRSLPGVAAAFSGHASCPLSHLQAQDRFGEPRGRVRGWAVRRAQPPADPRRSPRARRLAAWCLMRALSGGAPRATERRVRAGRLQPLDRTTSRGALWGPILRP